MIAELLLYGVDKSLEGKREGGADRFETLRVSDGDEARLERKCHKVVPFLLVVEQALGVICR